MSQAELTSRRSATVAAVKRLHTSSGRRDSKTFLVEGPQALREALTYRADLHQVYATADAIARWGELMHAVQASAVETTIVSESVLEAMAETKSPQGWLATCGMGAVSLVDVMATQPQVLVALDQVSDPGNVGTIIRTADAAGASGVLLTGESVDPFNGKCVRSSAGSIFHLPVVPALSVEQLVVAQLSGLGVRRPGRGRRPLHDRRADRLQQHLPVLGGARPPAHPGALRRRLRRSGRRHGRRGHRVARPGNLDRGDPAQPAQLR